MNALPFRRDARRAFVIDINTIDTFVPSYYLEIHNVCKLTRAVPYDLPVWKRFCSSPSILPLKETLRTPHHMSAAFSVSQAGVNGSSKKYITIEQKAHHIPVIRIFDTHPSSY